MPAKARGAVVTIMCVVAVSAVVSEWSTPLGAQWLNHPTAGVPERRRGHRISTRRHRERLTARRICPAPGTSSTTGPVLRTVAPTCSSGMNSSTSAGVSRRAALSAVGGGTGKERTAQRRKDDPDSYCLPTGILKMHTTPLMKKVIQVPGLVVILNEQYPRTGRYSRTDGPCRPIPVRRRRVFVGDVGRRHAGRTDDWIPGRPVARPQRRPDDRGGQGGRTVPPGQLWEAGDRAHRRRSQGVHVPWTVTLNQFLAPDTELLTTSAWKTNRTSRTWSGNDPPVPVGRSPASEPEKNHSGGPSACGSRHDEHGNLRIPGAPDIWYDPRHETNHSAYSARDRRHPVARRRRVSAAGRCGRPAGR